MAKLLGMTSLMTAGVAEQAWSRPTGAAQARSSIVPRGGTSADISIGRSELAQALRRFSRQANREVGFAPSLVRGRYSTPVKGRLDPDQALTRLLSGTGLSYRLVGTGYLLVAAAREAVVRSSAAPLPRGPEPEILVIGTRLDPTDATDVKRRALQSVSVLTEAEIAALPDTSLADVVRRIPGVQLSVRSGGGIVTIRGLSQTEDRINGRNLSSTVVRGFDIAALPSDIVSGIDVYKTPSASQIEGGIGGVIDFHTRRPFDRDGEASVTAKGVVGNLDGVVRPYMSGHVSGRRDTPVGEVGVLLGGSHQAQDIAQDLVRIDAIATQRTASNDTLAAPTSVVRRYLRGTKVLTSAYASAQWRPSDAIEVVGDLLHNRSTLDFTNMSLSANLAGATASGPFVRDEQNDALRSGRWADVPISSSTNRGIGAFLTRQMGLSVRYRRDQLTILADASRTTTNFDYGAPTLTLIGEAPGVSFDARRSLPRFVLEGVDPTSTAAWRFGTLSEFALRDGNTETAYRLDGTYMLGGVVESLKAGVRRARRSVDHRLGFRTINAPGGIGPVEGSGVTGLTDGRRSDDGDAQSRWVTTRAEALLPGQVGKIRSIFAADPAEPGFDPALSYRANEASISGYVEATFAMPLAGRSVQGNAGLRYAGTHLAIAGPSTAIAARRRYDHWLPSINLRADLGERTYLRLAYSRQLSRPAFNLLAPTASLDFVNATGEAGNPALDALTADQYDAALEYYPAGGGNLYAAAFYKQVDGFVRTQVGPETIGGRTFLIARPFNVDDGWIGGLETGFTRRFAALPGGLSGLGVQASYTFIGSFEADNGAGVRAPLEQMSRHNYNLALTYERDRISAAVLWTWRSRIVQISRGDAAGRPLFRDPYGQLDASATLPLSARAALTFGALNLLQRRTREYLGTARLLNQSFVESRRLLIGVTIRDGPT